MVILKSNSLRSPEEGCLSRLRSHDERESVRSSPIFLCHSVDHLRYATSKTTAENTSEAKVTDAPKDQGRLARYLQQHEIDIGNKGQVPTHIDVPQGLLCNDLRGGEMEDLATENYVGLSECMKAEEALRSDDKFNTLKEIQQNLKFEYKSMCKRVAQTDRKIQLSKKNINDLQYAIEQLQIQLQKQSIAMEKNENSRKEQRISLKKHKKRIEDINRCIQNISWNRWPIEALLFSHRLLTKEEIFLLLKLFEHRCRTVNVV